VNSRERVIESLSCRKPDRIPKALGFFPQSLSAIEPTDPETYFGLDVRYIEFNPPKGQDDFLDYLRGLPPDVHVGNRSQLTTYHEWQYHPERGEDHPLSKMSSIEAISEYVWPDVTHPDRYQGLARKVAAWHNQGYAVAGSPPHLGGELYEMAYRLRGFNRFLTDLVMRKNLARYLLDQLMEMMIHNAVILARAGIDILLLDDDIASPTGLIISPETWREFFGSRLARVIDIVKTESPELLVFYHSDGDFTRLLPDLVKIGVDVVNPLQPDCMNAVNASPVNTIHFLLNLTSFPK